MRLWKSRLDLLKNFSKKYNWDFYLFWSRVDDKKKWWDVDLLVINKENISNLKLSIILEREYFKNFNEKIDIVVFWKKMKKEQKLFFNSLTKEKIC
jgi:hypothetical protein